jgi:D-amino peptidase
MRIYVMTDLEGVAGVLNFEDWCTPDSRYYELAKELLTREVNAAVSGFYEGGATQVTVSDGHGHGGIHPVLLDPRVELIRGWPTGFPFLLDEGVDESHSYDARLYGVHRYDGLAWVGQHAMAGTPYAHLAHTQSFRTLDLSVNGVSIGEMGQLAMCASELGVRSIFLSGDRAACQEARALVPGIETVAVKRGTTPGRGDELDAAQYARRNLGAVHIHPERARSAIREGARRAVRRMAAEGWGLIDLRAPFERVARFRADGDQPPTVAHETHPSSVIALLNAPFDRRPTRHSDQEVVYV